MSPSPAIAEATAGLLADDGSEALGEQMRDEILTVLEDLNAEASPSSW
ncbi:MAG: hypothetical protein R2692_03625 [Microbacterium sp.]